MTLITTEPISYEKEEIVAIPVGRGADCIAVSGYANFHTGFYDAPGDDLDNGPFPFDLGVPEKPTLSGDPAALTDHDDDDALWALYKVELTVGPHWASIRDVSPVVNTAGFTFSDSDSADWSGVHIENCKWERVGNDDEGPPFERVKLIVSLRMCGGKGYHVTKLSYQFIAVGRLMPG